jgi:dUTPase
MFKDKIATFERVPKEQFIKDAIEPFKQFSSVYKESEPLVSDYDVKSILGEYYDKIIPPSRSTTGSAGYDFHMPYPVTLPIYTPVLIPTGIRCVFHTNMNDSYNYDKNMNQVIDASSDSYKGYSLDIYPRSSIGFKYQCYLANTVAIIDEDYYKSKNYGHIMIKLIKFGPGSIENMVYRATMPVYAENAKNIHAAIVQGTDLELNTGDRFAQGIFHEVFAATNDDETKMNKRVGGLGSTGQ